MAISFQSDQYQWSKCRHCGMAIWRYALGLIWRTPDRNSACARSPVKLHVSSPSQHRE